MGEFWKTDQDDRDMIVELYQNGQSVKDIAQMYGIHQTYVTVLAKKAGLPLRNKRVNSRV